MGNSLLLNVPYLSQLDNEYYPLGTCNLTSVAMVLRFYGFEPTKSSPKQFEDQLILDFEKNGLDRHSHQELDKLIKSYGLDNQFRTNATIGDIRAHLFTGNPVIIAGMFTASGHIIVVTGYDETGFFVNDPYGEYWSSGYDTTVPGEQLHYSNDLIRRTCDIGGIWAHFPKRKC